jgi:hypothetical protein
MKPWPRPAVCHDVVGWELMMVDGVGCRKLGRMIGRDMWWELQRLSSAEGGVRCIHPS